MIILLVYSTQCLNKYYYMMTDLIILYRLLLQAPIYRKSLAFAYFSCSPIRNSEVRAKLGVRAQGQVGAMAFDQGPDRFIRQPRDSNP